MKPLLREPVEVWTITDSQWSAATVVHVDDDVFHAELEARPVRIVVPHTETSWWRRRAESEVR
jgi:hypothetical protein